YYQRRNLSRALLRLRTSGVDLRILSTDDRRERLVEINAHDRLENWLAGRRPRGHSGGTGSARICCHLRLEHFAKSSACSMDERSRGFARRDARDISETARPFAGLAARRDWLALRYTGWGFLYDG